MRNQRDNQSINMLAAAARARAHCGPGCISIATLNIARICIYTHAKCIKGANRVLYTMRHTYVTLAANV